jgi:transcriptional regulator GlxA family with amidase domain
MSEERQSAAEMLCFSNIQCVRKVAVHLGYGTVRKFGRQYISQYTSAQRLSERRNAESVCE